MRRIFTLLVLAFIIGFASMAYSKTLVDVPSGHWAEDAVQKLVDAGLIDGYPDGTFGGNRPMTRYEYAMVISRLLDMLDKGYCLKSECKAPGGPVANPTSASGCACDITPEQLAEIKDIVKKLAAEFKDELAALKVRVDENSTQIAQLQKKVDNGFLGKLQVNGSIRQRIDVPNTDYENPDFTYRYKVLYGTDLSATTVQTKGLTAGYEMVPTLRFNGEAGKGVAFQIELSKYIRNQATVAGKDDNLNIQDAFVDLDFSGDVRELDLLKIRSGYQKASFGPYGMLVDNYGVQSSPGVLVSVAKDMVSFAGFGIMIDPNNTFTSYANTDGLGSTGKDLYTAGRVGLNLPFVNLGVFDSLENPVHPGVADL